MRHIGWIAAVALGLLGPSAAAQTSGELRARSWIVTPRGEVDGMLLTDASSVRFPAALGRTIVRHVRLGERVEFSSDRSTLSAPRTGWHVVLDAPPQAVGGGPRGARANSGSATRAAGVPSDVRFFLVRGRVAGIVYTQKREADGFVIDGGVTVHVPDSQSSLLSAIRPGDLVAVAGFGVQGPHGVGLIATRIQYARSETTTALLEAGRVHAGRLDSRDPS